MKRRTRETIVSILNTAGSAALFVMFMTGLVLYWAGWVHIKAYAMVCAAIAALLFYASEKLDDSRDEITFDELEDEHFTMRRHR